MTEGDLLSVQVQATDPDGNALTYTKISGPNLATVSNTGLITWQTKDGDVGNYLFLIRVSDNKTSTDMTFRVTVKEKTTTGDDDNDNSFWMFLMGGLAIFILLLLIIVVVLLLFLRKRRLQQQQKEDDGPKTLIAEQDSDRAFVEKRYADLKKPKVKTSKMREDAPVQEPEGPKEEIPLLPPASVVTDMPPPPPFATQPMDTPPAASVEEPPIQQDMQAPPQDFAKPPEVAPTPDVMMDQFRASPTDTPAEAYSPGPDKIWSPDMVESRTAKEAGSAIKMLKQLNELKAAGAITAEEYEASKRKLLRKI
jgi:hypothetical protein